MLYNIFLVQYGKGLQYFLYKYCFKFAIFFKDKIKYDIHQDHIVEDHDNFRIYHGFRLYSARCWITDSSIFRNIN